MKYRDKNVLVISKGSWRNDNNTGNTLNNFFSDWQGYVYSISCSAEPSNDSICKKHFVLPEKDLINKLFNKNESFGYEQSCSSDDEKKQKEDEEFYKYYRTHKSHFKYFLRDCLWKITCWHSDELDDFLNSIEVDAIFMVAYGQSYMYDILQYCSKRLNIPVYLSFMDDYYTLKQISVSPFFWIRRIYLRRIIRKNVKQAHTVYAISPKQAREYSKCFKRDFPVLNKFVQINKNVLTNNLSNKNKVSIIYAGNIMCGRYKTLGLISKVVHELSNDGLDVEFTIYTRNPMTDEIKKHLRIHDCVIYGGALKADSVQKEIESADIVIHVESFDLHERYDTRLSFSTKIVDYFALGKCIFAVGWKKSASMEYLDEHNAAVLAFNKKDIYNKLKVLVKDKNIRNQFEANAYKCGCNFHNIEKKRSVFLK